MSSRENESGIAFAMTRRVVTLLFLPALSLGAEQDAEAIRSAWMKKDASLVEEAKRIPLAEIRERERKHFDEHFEKKFDLSIPGYKRLFYRLAMEKRLDRNRALDRTLYAHYVACGYAMKGSKDAALDWLAMSFRLGSVSEAIWTRLSKARELDGVRNDPRFGRILQGKAAEPRKEKPKKPPPKKEPAARDDKKEERVESLPFLSLKPGTHWVYVRGRSAADLVWTITRTGEGKTYVESREGDQKETSVFFVEKHILMWGTGPKEALPIFKLGSKKGDKWDGVGEHLGRVEVKVPAGTYPNALHIRIFERHYYLEPRIGILKIEYPGGDTIELKEIGRAKPRRPEKPKEERLPPKSPRTFLGHALPVGSIAFDAKGRLIASGTWGGDVRIWSAAEGKELRRISGNAPVVFRPDGKVLATATWDYNIRLWEMGGITPIKMFRGHSGLVHALAFHPEGKILASGSGDREIRLWDLGEGKTIRVLAGHSKPVRALSFRADGKVLASGSDDFTIKLWDVRSGKEIRTLEGHSSWVSSVAFAPAGGTLASASWDGIVKLWDTESGKVLHTLTDHEDRVSCVSFRKDGKLLASGGGDRTIRLWEVATGKAAGTLAGHTAPVLSVAWDPDDPTFLLSGGEDKSVRLWKIPASR